MGQNVLQEINSDLQNLNIKDNTHQDLKNRKSTTSVKFYQVGTDKFYEIHNIYYLPDEKFSENRSISTKFKNLKEMMKIKIKNMFHKKQ